MDDVKVVSLAQFITEQKIEEAIKRFIKDGYTLQFMTDRLMVFTLKKAKKNESNKS